MGTDSKFTEPKKKSQLSMEPSKKVMLLRGLSRGNGHWGSFPDILRYSLHDYEIELMELPGNGTWHKETTPLDVDDVIQRIRERSHLFKSPGSVYILGLSLGGMVGLKWAEKHPEEIAGVLMVNSSLAQLSPFFRRLQIFKLGAVFQALMTKDPTTREQRILDLISSNHSRSGGFIRDFVKFSSAHPVAYANFVRQLGLAMNIKISAPPVVPVRILVSENDLFVHSSCSYQIAKEWNLEIISHPSAGHDVPLDDPEWLTQKTVEFIKS